MPIYEYRCQSCGRQHEALQKVSDPPLKSCPSCGKRALRRLMSAPRFRLKGAGWYETDFKSDKETRRNLAESGGEPAPASKGDGAGDSAGASGADKTGGKTGDSTSETASARPTDRSESGERPGKPAAAKADGKAGARPSAVRKSVAVRKPAARQRARRGRA